MTHEPDRATYKHCAAKATTSSATKPQIQATKQRSDNTVQVQCRCPGHKIRGFKMAFVLKDCEEWFSVGKKKEKKKKVCNCRLGLGYLFGMVSPMGKM